MGYRRNENKVDEFIQRNGCWIPVLAFIIAFLLSLIGCKTKTKIEYVDREVVKYEYKTIFDTLVQNAHDSIFQTIYQKGDTIYNIKYKEVIKYKNKSVNKTDTVYKDSIQVQYLKETVEKKVTPKWCYYCLLVSVLFAIFAIYKLYKWLQAKT